MILLNPFSTTGLTIASSAYTFYKIHPFIPYSFIWHNAIVPGTCLVLQSIKNTFKPHEQEDNEHDVEIYQLLSADESYGIVTKYLIFEQEPQFTYLGVEYVENDKGGGPVFL